MRIVHPLRLLGIALTVALVATVVVVRSPKVPSQDQTTDTPEEMLSRARSLETTGKLTEARNLYEQVWKYHASTTEASVASDAVRRIFSQQTADYKKRLCEEIYARGVTSEGLGAAWAEATRKLSARADDVNSRMTWYSAKPIRVNDRTEIEAYFGDRLPADPLLWWRVTYAGDTVVLSPNVIVLADEKSFSITHPELDGFRDWYGSRSWVSLDLPGDPHRELLDAVTRSRSATLRLRSANGDFDHTITASEKSALATVLAAYDARLALTCPRAATSNGEEGDGAEDALTRSLTPPVFHDQHLDPCSKWSIRGISLGMTPAEARAKGAKAGTWSSNHMGERMMWVWSSGLRAFPYTPFVPTERLSVSAFGGGPRTQITDVSLYLVNSEHSIQSFVTSINDRWGRPTVENQSVLVDGLEKHVWLWESDEERCEVFGRLETYESHAEYDGKSFRYMGTELSLSSIRYRARQAEERRQKASKALFD